MFIYSLGSCNSQREKCNKFIMKEKVFPVHMFKITADGMQGRHGTNRSKIKGDNNRKPTYKPMI